MKFNVEFDKLIKTIGHRALFSRNDVEHTQRCQEFIWTLSQCYLSSPKVVTSY